MATITLALLAACVAGFFFKATRGIGIAAMTALILLNPGAFVVFLGVGVVALFFYQRR